MTTLRQAAARFASFFRRQTLDRDFDEELAAHIDLATEEHLRQGMTPAEARRRALIAFGGIGSAKEIHRESRGLPWLDGVVQDIRYAARGLRRSPGFTLVAVATLALGIGINGTVFTVTNAVLFKGFPLVEHNERLVYITSRAYGCCTSYPDFEDWRARARSFDGMGLVRGVSVSLSDRNGFPQNYELTWITAGTFGLVGQQPILGRDFTAADEIPGAAPVAILSDSLWERRYARDPAILGRVVRINGAATTVIGVMARGFSFPQRQDLWMPLVPTPEIRKREARFNWFAFGRLAGGVTIESARSELAAIGAELAVKYPRTNLNQLPVVQTFDQFFVGPDATTIYGSMWGAVGLVLLIACANLANLMLARATARGREMSLRLALGSGRWRIIRQIVVESLMLSAMGGIAGWWIVTWGVRAYQGADRAWRVLDYTVDARVFAYLVVLSIGTGLLFGLAPALRLSRLDLNTALKDGGRGSSGGRRGRHVSALLVIGEMALAVVLMAGAGVMIRSFLKVYTRDLGVQSANVLTMEVGLPEARYGQALQRTAFFDRLTTRLQSIPGVESVAMASRMPGARALPFPYELDGAAPADALDRPILSGLIIDPSYFHTLGASVLSGRPFNEADNATSLPVVVVNRRFASDFWPGEEPLGKRLRLFGQQEPGTWRTVVGVVSNIAQAPATAMNLAQEFLPLAYLPYRQQPAQRMWMLARANTPAASLAPQVRREFQALDADLPIGLIWTLNDWLRNPSKDQGNLTALFLIFAATALLLASLGLYAVIAHSVSQRTQEIGIRMAIGATARDILTPVLVQGMRPLVIGLAIGLVASLGVNGVLRSQLIEVSPTDPLTYAGVIAVLIAAAALGCLIPARRAMRVDPVIALRHD